MKKKKQYKKYLHIVIVLILILLVYGIYLLISNNKNVINDTSKDIVFTSYESTEYEQEVPNINIKKISNSINNEINMFVKPYIEKENSLIEYHYNVSGNILSLIIAITETKNESVPDIKFKTYNINLRQLKVLSDSEVLSLFDTDANQITNKINNIFNKYYNEELNNNIIPKTMTYEDYLKIRDLNNINNKIYYYINNSRLETYVAYNIYSEEETSFYLEEVGYSFYIN